MSEEAKAVQETAKAVQELSQAVKSYRESVHQLGEFIGGIIGPPAREIGGLVADSFQMKRQLLALNFKIKYEKMLVDRGVESTRTIPMAVGVPLIEAATLEEDADLTDMFANLLVSYVDGGQSASLPKMFVETLRQLSPAEAAVLKAIHLAPESAMDDHGTLYTEGLPNSYHRAPRNEDERFADPAPQLSLLLESLRRLGCIEGSLRISGRRHFKQVHMTKYGSAFLEACGVTRPTV